LPDGKLLITGNFGVSGGETKTVLRLNADGTADATFAPITVIGGSVSVARQLPDGKILACGTLNTIQNRNYLVRYGNDGVMDIPIPAQALY
jgi:hypothetical protein